MKIYVGHRSEIDRGLIQVFTPGIPPHFTKYKLKHVVGPHPRPDAKPHPTDGLGFLWGSPYPKGSRHTALSILNDCLQNRERAELLYVRLAIELFAPFPIEGFILMEDAILNWVQEEEVLIMEERN